jgi:hypothetical protein
MRKLGRRGGILLQLRAMHQRQHALIERADGTKAREATKAIAYLAASLAGVVPAALIP